MTRQIALTHADRALLVRVVEEQRHSGAKLCCTVMASCDAKAYALSIGVQELLERKEIASVSFEPPYRVTMQNGSAIDFRLAASEPVPM